MTSDSIFSSSSSEQRWVNQISKTITIDIIAIPVCVFHIPKTLSAVKPEVYAPQQIGLGPYHHLRPELYNKMERHKLAAARRVLKPDQIHNFQHLVIDKLKEHEPTIRACYDEYLDLDGDTLAWVVATDGLFLLDLLQNHGTSEAVESDLRKTERDIMMLENQIPFLVLKEIRKAIKLTNGENDLLFCVTFCEAYSPLLLNRQRQFRLDTRRAHLLDYMYNLIVSNRGIPEAVGRINVVCLSSAGGIVKFVEVAGGGGPITMVAQLVEFMLKVPWDKIIALFKGKSDASKTKVEKITIPSVSNLSKIGGVKFSLTSGGIKDIVFDDMVHTLYLPVIKLSVDSEVILRNLVAYEASMAMPGSTLELAEYVDLMCGIIDTAKDVKFLRQEHIGIIEGDLSDDEIAELFNGISKSTVKPKNKSDLQNTIDKINNHFENRPRVKVFRRVKKYVYAFLKFLASLSGIVVVVVGIIKAYCAVYGCGTRFFDDQ